MSVCIIAMNEEDNLPRCLASVAWADEIIVVDSHSTDRTREMAAEAGARVIERDFPGYIEQKNFAMSQATHDWVLCLDADEELSPELSASVQAALEDPGDADGFMSNRCNYYNDRWIRHGGWYPDCKTRLVRKANSQWRGLNPHDVLHVDGKVGRLKGDLLHYTYRDMTAQFRQTNLFTDIAARVMFENGTKHRLHNLVLRPWVTFLKSYFWRLGFLDGSAGFVLAVTGSYYVFLKYAKLAELHRRATS